MSDLITDLRYALRSMLRQPGFTATALIILMLGIGANAAIFSLVDGAILRPLPFPDPGQLVHLDELAPSGEAVPASPLNYLDWEKQSTVFESIAASSSDRMTFTRGDRAISLKAVRATAHIFDMLRTQPMLGRTFVAGEDQPGHDHVAVLSHAFWASELGADPHIVGKTIPLDTQAYTVIGVLPAGGPYDRTGFSVWVPLVFDASNRARDLHWLDVRARLKPGVSLEQAQAEMSTIGARLAHDFPEADKGWGVKVERLASALVGDSVRQSIYLLFAMVVMVLLIACANLANLGLARGLARQREVVIRTSLGSSRMRLIRQLLTESVLISTLGGLLGIGVARAVMAIITWALPLYTLPAEAEIRLDGRVLAFTLFLAVATGVASGLMPAIHITRCDLAGAMKQGGINSSTDRRGRRLRGILVIGEVALAFMLLSCAGLLLRDFAHQQRMEIAYDPSRVVLASLPIPNGQYQEPQALISYLKQIDARVRALPGVTDVALSTAGPLDGWGWGMPVQVAGQPVMDRTKYGYAGFKMITPSYFSTLHLRVLRGRFLSSSDRAGSPPVTVINEAMAKKYFPGRNPIGQRLLVQRIELNKLTLGPDVAWEVVGVVAGERNASPSSPTEAEGMYVPLEQSPVRGYLLLVRTRTNPGLIEKALLPAVDAVNRDQTLPFMATLEERKAMAIGGDGLRSALLGTFAALALGLSAIGLYGVLSYSVTQRTREIGIRAALGASSQGILQLVIREGLILIAVGLAAGLVAAFCLARLLSTLLVGIGGQDFWTMAVSAAVLLGAGFLACYLPARRATRVTPLVALQSE